MHFGLPILYLAGRDPRISGLYKSLLLVLLPCLLSGCFSRTVTPDLAQIYSRSAQYHGPDRNPVIVIPGILGSRLVDIPSKQIVWGAFSGNFADPTTPQGARSIAIPMAEGKPLAVLKDNVVSDGALDRIKVSFLGLPFNLEEYAQILSVLGVGGFRDEQLGKSGAIDYGDDHYTCFQFDYDWRRGIEENALRLHDFIKEKQKYVQAEIKKRYGVEKERIKFDIVAHSMGGLIARYFLRFGSQSFVDGKLPEVTWEGATWVERVILVAPPNAGSLLALQSLVYGERFGLFLPHYPPALLGTMPSIYQLLPRTRHGAYVTIQGEKIPDIFDSKLWQRMGWGLASPQQEEVLKMLLPQEQTAQDRRRIALEHQEKCLLRAKQVTAALDQPATLPKDLSLYLIAGDAEPTDAVVSIDDANGKMQVIAKRPGDGIVLRSSALMDERLGGRWEPAMVSPIPWSQVIFLFQDHSGLIKNSTFSDNVLYILLEMPRL